MILAPGPGHTTQTVGIFENPWVTGTRSVKIKNTLRRGCQLILHKLFIFGKFKCEKDDRFCAGDNLSSVSTKPATADFVKGKSVHVLLGRCLEKFRK